jgi:hypothetical protein
MALVIRGRRNNRHEGWLRLLLAWLLVSGLASGPRAAAILTEYEVKAGFLYRFGWFVEWPATAVQRQSHVFIIGVLGANPFGDLLDEIMQGKTVRERSVVVQYYQQAEDVVDSHVLFISAAEEPRLPAILAGLGQTPVLTVSDMARFTERGGMIELRLVDRKVHFDVNVDATERAGLKLSSQLLRLAKVIHGTPRGRE